MMTAIKPGFLRFFAVLLALLMTSSLAAANYVINYDYEPGWVWGGDGPNISATEKSLFITETFNQYTEVNWEIVAAERQGDGTVWTEVRYEESGWDPYHSSSVTSFEILSSNGSGGAEPVIVDSWSAVQLNYDLAVQFPLLALCCDTYENSIDNPWERVSALGGPSEANYGGGYLTRSVGDSSFGSYELLTNTTYYIHTRIDLYVEILLGEWLLGERLWDEYEYDSFVEMFGLSGTTHHQVDGALQFGMVVRSVPEPSALALFVIGIVALSLMLHKFRNDPTYRVSGS
jgi:hypothetical protein